jgi:hypothetical protein
MPEMNLNGWALTPYSLPSLPSSSHLSPFTQQSQPAAAQRVLSKLSFQTHTSNHTSSSSCTLLVKPLDSLSLVLSNRTLWNGKYLLELSVDGRVAGRRFLDLDAKSSKPGWEVEFGGWEGTMGEGEEDEGARKMTREFRWETGKGENDPTGDVQPDCESARSPPFALEHIYAPLLGTVSPASPSAMG